MALLCCCYGHLLFSGLASLGYTGGGDVYVNDSGACGRRTDFVIEYLVCSGILYAALQSFLSFDTGFQLSFLAVLSILFIYPVISRYWRVRHPVPRYIWGIVAVSLAAQLGTAPVVIYKFAYFLFIFTGQSDSGTFSACYNLWIGSKFCLVSFYGIAYMGGKRIERGVAVAE